MVVLASAVSSPERKTRRRRRQQHQPKDDADAAASMLLSVSSAEKGLRLLFMEELMQRARNRDVAGVSEVIYDMIAAGLSPGPRSFHGLIVSHVLNGDDEGAVSFTIQFSIIYVSGCLSLYYFIMNMWMK